MLENKNMLEKITAVINVVAITITIYATATSTAIASVEDELLNITYLGVIIPTGTASDWDYYIRERAVAIWYNGSLGEGWYVYYAGYNSTAVVGSNGDTYIGLAFGKELTNLTKYSKNPIITYPHVGLQDPTITLSPTGEIILVLEDEYGTSPDTSILLYKSTDGVNFTYEGVLYDVSDSPWATAFVGTPTIVRYNGLWYLWYEGKDSSGTIWTGLAYGETLDNLTDYGKPLPNSNQWSDTPVQTIVNINGTWYAYGHAFDNGVKKTWLAKSSDGINFTKIAPVTTKLSPTFIEWNGTRYLLFGHNKVGDFTVGVQLFKVEGSSGYNWIGGIISTPPSGIEVLNVTPKPIQNIVAKIYSEILFAVNFSREANCSWYLNGELLKTETAQNTSIVINFTSEGIHEVLLKYDKDTIKWTVKIYKPYPSFTLKLHKHSCMVTESVGLQINITNLHELFDYEIRIDIGDDGVADIITKEFNVTLPSFTRPDRYKIAVYVVDPITGAFNKTEAYLQVFAYKLFRGYNIMNTTGAVIYAESAEPVHAVIKPIKVTQNFTVIVSEENIFTNETGDIILNVTFVGLAGGDKVWLNETVVNARTVDLLHNGEPLLLAIPVENRSVNLTLTSFSTYTLVVNNTVAPMREQPPPEKEAFTIEEVLVLIGVTILLIAIIAGIHHISKKAKAKTLARMESEFKFFRRLK